MAIPGIIECLLLSVSSLVIGYLLGTRRGQQRLSSTEQALVGAKAQQELLQQQVSAMTLAQEQLQQQLQQRIEQVVQAQTKMELWQQQAQWSDKLLETGKHMLEQSFAGLASKALQSNNEQFLQVAEQRLLTAKEQAGADLAARQQAIEHLLMPLQTALQSLQQKNEQFERQQAERDGKFQQQLLSLFENMQQLGQTTHQLATTLKGSHSKGKWGELALRNIAELAGMTKHCDFDEQIQLANGKRPDMLIHLPGKRYVTIDAKVPLDAYVRWQAASSELERLESAKKHVEVMRGHIKALIERDYGSAHGLQMVILFVPFESMLGLAFEESPDLYNQALQQGVLLATPTTLVALLRTLGLYWEQHALAENSQRIAECAATLYSRAVNFQKELHHMGAHLSKAVQSYNKAIGSFEQRLMPMGRKLEALQATERCKESLQDNLLIETALREIAAES